MKTVCQCLLTKKSENLSVKSRRGCLDNLAWGWYTSKVPTYAGVLELADETDSKSVGGDTVWVRPPSPAPIVPKWFLPLRYFLFGRQNGFISRWFWRTSSPNGAFLPSDFSFGRFLFFGEFSKIDFACNYVRSLHFAVHVNVGINIGRGGKAGMSQPHLYLFHCDFVLD